MISWTERAKAEISKKGQNRTDKTDESRVLGVLSVSSVPESTISGLKKGLSSVLSVPPPAVLKKHGFLQGVIEDPDRWCWPHSPAMNGEEIGTFMVRERRFIAKGLSRTDGQVQADRLVRRDRESDDRRVCLECDHLDQGWRCNNWLMAGGGMGTNRSHLADVFVQKLQRCDGFSESG